MSLDRISQKTRDTIKFAGELIRNSKNTVLLTGAGISTPSGIPDFRSEGTGLWSVNEPLEVASLNTFRHSPEKFFSWIRPLAKLIVTAEPNSAHMAVTELETAGYINTIVTQNIDDLHQKSGSKNVVETHGSLSSMTCTKCFHNLSSKPFINPFINKGELPYCPKCSSILKPDVILFGEQMPYGPWEDALSAVSSCELMIVAGSSLEVLPVASLPLKALDKGAHLIIVNQTPTYLGVRADIVFMDDVIDILPQISRQILDYA
ncbi:NAD-dependent deacetylase [Chloroflexota bacterium]